MMEKLRSNKNYEGIEAIVTFIIGVIGINIAILFAMEQPENIVDDGPGAIMMASVMLIGMSIYNFKQWVEK